MSNTAHNYVRYRTKIDKSQGARIASSFALREESIMHPPLRKRPPVILNFSCAPAALQQRESLLTAVGYLVLNSSNGFDAIGWSASGEVDAAVLEVDGNAAEVCLIAQEMKRRCPGLRFLVLLETQSPVDRLAGISEFLLPKKTAAQTLLKCLQDLISSGTMALPSGTPPAEHGLSAESPSS